MTKTRKERKAIGPLAKALGADPGWVGALVERLGGKVRADGSFDDHHLRMALDKLAPVKGGAGKIDLASREAMGGDQETCRLFLIQELRKHGMKVIHREEARNARLTIDLPSGKRIWAMSYVSLRTKSNPGQTGFTGGPGRLGDCYDWYFYVAQPFGKIYALSREDMHAIWKRRDNAGPLGRLVLSFSQGVDTFLLANRIDEMLGVAESRR